MIESPRPARWDEAAAGAALINPLLIVLLRAMSMASRRLSLTAFELRNGADLRCVQDRRSAALCIKVAGGLPDIGGKSDVPALGGRRVRELADGREDGGDGLVVVFVLALQLIIYGRRCSGSGFCIADIHSELERSDSKVGRYGHGKICKTATILR
ncbi:MAG: hypothetical protein ACYCSD_11580 [Acidiferrobacteraceae bacterium]